MSDLSRYEDGIPKGRGLSNRLRSRESSTDLLEACLAVSEALADQKAATDSAGSDVDLLAEPDGLWNTERTRLNAAIARVQNLISVSDREFGAKLRTFYQVEELLGRDDPRVIDFAYAIVTEVGRFFPSDHSAGREVLYRKRVSAHATSATRRPTMQRPDFAGLFGWPRRSQSPE